jgi:hypothetical protein
MAVVNTRPQAVLSYCKGDISEPVVEHAIGDALRLAGQKWGGRIALVDGSPTANHRRVGLSNNYSKTQSRSPGRCWAASPLGTT